jgi:uroporphyrinogen decarboxylase
MTPLEILNAAHTGQPAPRIPIFCNMLDQGTKELGMSQATYYSRGEYVAAGQLALQKKYGYDNVWSLFYVGKEAELLGCNEILYSEDGTPNVADFVIKTYDDIVKLEIPDVLTAHPAWQETAACLKILREEVGNTHPICAYLTASTTLPAILMGMDKWMELLMSKKGELVELREELLRKCSDFFQKEIAAYRAAGANVLIYSTPFGSTSFVSKKQFQEFSLPWMERDLAAGGVENILYYCGMAPFNDVIGQIQEKFGISSYYISPMSDLAQAKEIIGQTALTCGVIDDIQMIHWTAEQTRAEVKRICEIGKVGGHFLFGTGVMPLQIPEENIRAMLAAAFEYGAMPM